MNWESQVPGSFGSVDCNFAVHPLDMERAKGAIEAAKKAGAFFEDFEKEMVWHVYKQFGHVPNEHMSEQIKIAKKLW